MATPHSAREGRDLVTFAAAACCTEISFTQEFNLLVLCKRCGRIIILRRLTDEAAAYGFTVDLHLVISYGSCGNSTYVTEYCTVIGPALHSARQQTAVKLPDPFPLL